MLKRKSVKWVFLQELKYTNGEISFYGQVVKQKEAKRQGILRAYHGRKAVPDEEHRKMLHLAKSKNLDERDIAKAYKQGLNFYL